jgi:hypothetical protein
MLLRKGTEALRSAWRSWPWDSRKLSHAPGFKSRSAQSHLSTFRTSSWAGLRTAFLVVFPLRIACAFLHVERGQSSKRVWRSPQIIYCLCPLIHPGMWRMESTHAAMIAFVHQRIFNRRCQCGIWPSEGDVCVLSGP